MQQWGAERIEELATLVAVSTPADDLTADELLTALYDQPGIVLGPDDATGLVGVGVGRDRAGRLVASVRIVAVHPDRRRTGVGTALLDAAEGWALDHEAERIELGGLLPFALWPGVGSDGGLLELAGRRGFEATGHLRAYAVPVSFRSPAPAGVVVRRAVREEDVTAVTLAVAALWPRYSDEVARALDHGTCHVALASSAADPEGRDGEVVAVGCHSVTRAAWVGPLAVRPERRREGIGSALLGQICRDLMIAEFPAAEVHGVVDGGSDEMAAFLDAAGATPCRSYRTLAKSLRP